MTRQMLCSDPVSWLLGEFWVVRMACSVKSAGCSVPRDLLVPNAQGVAAELMAYGAGRSASGGSVVVSQMRYSIAGGMGMRELLCTSATVPSSSCFLPLHCAYLLEPG